MQVDDFDYELPDELIAQTPLADRSKSRLLVVDPVTETLQHTEFARIVDHLSAGDVLVLNNSRVIPARLYGRKAGTGAGAELLLTTQTDDDEWIALAKPAKRLRVGTRLYFSDANHAVESDDDAVVEDSPYAEVVEELDEGMRRLRFHVSGPMDAFLDRFGVMPLPHYIREPLRDRERYQTVYAEPPGSVAAPTAGLHFTPELLDEIRRRGVEVMFVTLHVGIGTFRPVSVDTVEAHHMHSEWYEVSPETADAVNRAKRDGRRVIAVGTTALRTLESAGKTGKVQVGTGDTDIFIYPGYSFQIVDALITNFHLPKSTLIMLIATLMGLPFTKHAYQVAVESRYRFFSFGDSMFITRSVQR